MTLICKHDSDHTAVESGKSGAPILRIVTISIIFASYLKAYGMMSPAANNFLPVQYPHFICNNSVCLPI